MSSVNYSCIPENRIISSFKRFTDEKRKNMMGSANKRVQELPEQSKTSVTYQSQIISCYYSLTTDEQNNFWDHVETSDSLREELQNLNDEEFYFKILQEITKFFGIQRNSPTLQDFLIKKILYAYNDNGDKIYATKILRFDDEQHVVQGMLTKDNPALCSKSNEEWVMKWSVGINGEDITDSEMDKWKLIENNGAQIPRIVSGFMILDFFVVVIEKLEPLTPIDYNQKLIVSMISFIEKQLPIGVNNNLKPENIMKRVEKDRITYLVADVSMMTTKEKDYGYQRFSWSPLWASQVVDLDTITTVKNDLLEFGYVLIWLSYGDDIQDVTKSEDLVENIRTVPRKEEVAKWIERVKKINEQDIKLNDFIELKKLAMLFPKVGV